MREEAVLDEAVLQERLQDLSLPLYRAGERFRDEGQSTRSGFAFLLSMSATGYHPNALYQSCARLAEAGELDLARAGLDILLTHTPLHEGGRRLKSRLDAESSR